MLAQEAKMSRSNISKLYIMVKKLETQKQKIERRISNLKKEYVRTIQAVEQVEARIKVLQVPPMPVATEEVTGI